MLKENRTKILIIGPFPNPITGNSLANQILYEGLSKNNKLELDRVNTSLPFFDEKIGKLSLNKLMYNLKFYFKLYKVFKVSVVYITPGQSFLGVVKYAPFIFTSKICFKKIVIHVHGNYLNTMYSKANVIKKRISKLILSQANKGIVLSESLRKNLKPFLKDKDIYVVHNFFEDELINNVEEKIKNKSLDNLKILYLSNLMEEKGVFDFLEALQILKEKSIKFNARIAGNIDVRHKSKVYEYLDKLKREVEYLGVVRGKEKKELLLWSNIFVFPTYYKMEGQPIALIEAMATGNVILTTQHAGIPDVISIKNGIFIDKKSPKDIVEKLQFVYQNESFKKVMIYNYNYSTENFSVNQYISNIQYVFDETV